MQLISIKNKINKLEEQVKALSTEVEGSLDSLSAKNYKKTISKIQQISLLKKEANELQAIYNSVESSTKVRLHPSLTLLQARLEFNRLNDICLSYSSVINSLGKLKNNDLKEKLYLLLEKRDSLGDLIDDFLNKTTIVLEAEFCDEDNTVIEKIFEKPVKKSKEIIRDEDDFEIDPNKEWGPDDCDFEDWIYIDKIDEVYMQSGSNVLQVIDTVRELNGTWSKRIIGQYLDRRFHRKENYFDPENLGN